MKTIKIDKLRDIIIVEKSNGKKILKNSLLFCGCCGKSLATAKVNIELPIDYDNLERKVKNKSFEFSMFGLKHKKCGHSMFGFRHKIRFIKLKDYLFYNGKS